MATVFLNKNIYLSCWFSVFSEAREELRNDLLIDCCSFVLRYESLWQCCHRKGETLAVEIFLEFSSQASHIDSPVHTTWYRCSETRGLHLSGMWPVIVWKAPNYSISILFFLEDLGEFSWGGGQGQPSKFSDPLGGQINRRMTGEGSD